MSVIPLKADSKLAPRPRSWRPDPMLLVFLLLVALLVFLVANPILRLLAESLRGVDGWSFERYAQAFGRSRYVDALWTTLQLGLASTALSLVIALPMAWGVSRTNLPAKGFFNLSVLAAFIMPPFLGAIAWILLAGPNAGWVNRAWMALFGTAGGPVNLFSFWGLALVIALYAFPLVYIFAKSALDLISTELEDAAFIHGAGKLATLRRVTLPLVLPAVCGAAILVFLEAIALYGTPVLIAIPAGINVATTQMATFFEYPLRVEVAAAYAMPMLATTVVLLGVQRMLLARKGYVSVSGKGGERRPLDIGAWRWVLFAWCGLVALITVLLPLVVLLQSAFSRAWGRGFSLDNLTLANFSHILLEQATVRGAIVNTFVYAGAAALACVAIGLAVAYVVQRRLLPFPGVLQFLSLAPFAVPGIVLAVAFYAAYAGPPFSLYGTGLLIVIAYITRFLPISATAATAAVKSLNPELEEAVRIMGGSRYQAVSRVVVPLLGKTLFGSFILVFIIATRELSTAVFLSGPETRVMSVLILDLSEQGNYEVLSAIGVVMLVVTGALVALGMKFVGRDFMTRRRA
ncbi:iron ABC transporter permease [Verticiella sediminum]|uniref:Iron ABC transporter permease n=1 Tax=Verticiella sediminum TaxID=1247510 RepID=A0A556AQ54_9BURK|nr:iron ABC transporter permease [Verticiella sediminum]TSH95034.1 iron ABC transporter permease [Verticiella sediminum]